MEDPNSRILDDSESITIILSIVTPDYQNIKKTMTYELVLRKSTSHFSE